MTQLKLVGMRAVLDDILADGLKCQHSVQRIVGDLVKAEIAEKQTRSIKYQMTIARLPLAKELVDFTGTPHQRGPGPQSRHQRLHRASTWRMRWSGISTPA